MVTEMEQEIDYGYEPECSGGKGKGILAGLGFVGIVTAVGAVVIHKTKDKREQKTIERLRKNGYVIFKEDECEVREMEEFEEDDVTIEPEN